MSTIEHHFDIDIFYFSELLNLSGATNSILTDRTKGSDRTWSLVVWTLSIKYNDNWLYCYTHINKYAHVQ